MRVLASTSTAALGATFVVITSLSACSPSAPGPAPSAPSTSTATSTSGTADPVTTPSTGTPVPAGAVTVDCDDPITALDVPEASMHSVLDAVAVATTVPSYDTAGPGEPHRFFAKTGLAIRVGRPSVLTVARTSAASASIFWGNRSAQWGSALSVPACPLGAGEHGSWIVLPGGFWVDRPTCVPLTVTADGRTSTLRVGVGTRCTTT